MEFAPVLLSVYNRVEHFRQCVTSLQQCEGARETVVYISSDAAAKPEDEPKVQEIRQFISQITGFKEVIPVYSEINTKGGIIKEAYSIVFKNYDRLIRSEDDNIFATSFLNFINYGLNKYEQSNNVFAICGYNFPNFDSKNYKSDSYFLKTFVAWGYGIWRNRYDLYSFFDKNTVIKDRTTLQLVKNNSDQLYFILMNDLYSLKSLGDARIGYYIYKNNLVSLFPVKSLVKNTGFDGSGKNCGIDGMYQNQSIDINFSPTIWPINFEIYPEFQYFYKKYTTYSFYTKLKAILRLEYLKLNSFLRKNGIDISSRITKYIIE